VDGLYWRFIETHRAFFTANPRLTMMPRMLDKMDPLKKQKIFAEAEILLANLTVG
jgi:deoxyribodipyrimidine photolyase-related protein